MPGLRMAATVPGPGTAAAAVPGLRMAATVPGPGTVAAAVPGLRMAATVPGSGTVAAAVPGLRMAATVPGTRNSNSLTTSHHFSKVGMKTLGCFGPVRSGFNYLEK